MVMRKLSLHTIPLLVIPFVVLLAAGCATNGDIERLEQSIARAQSTADEAKSAAASAQKSAIEAKGAAANAQRSAEAARADAANARLAAEAADRKADRMLERKVRK